MAQIAGPAQTAGYFGLLGLLSQSGELCGNAELACAAKDRRRADEPSKSSISRDSAARRLTERKSGVPPFVKHLLFCRSDHCVSSVAHMPRPDDRLPIRSPYLQDGAWLITLFKRDAEMTRLLRHLDRVHNVVTVGELDAAGWNVVNSFRGQIAPEKLTGFFQKIGRKRDRQRDGQVRSEAAILPFRKP